MQVDNKEKIEKLTGIKVIATVKKDDREILNLDKFFKEIK
jgi:hypothetical protein